MAVRRSLGIRHILVLISCFYLQFISYGFSNSFGVFYPELSRSYKGGKGETAWVGSLAGSLVFLIGPVATYLINRFGYRVVSIMGAIMSSTGLIVSIFAPNIYYLFVTYGIMTGIGNGLMCTASIMAISEYFPAILATVIGIITAGGGLGLTVYPVLVTLLVDKYGFRMSLWTHAGLFVQGIAVSTLLRPMKKNNSAKVSFISGLTTLRHNGVKLQIGAALLNCFAFYIPMFYLPDHASSMNISSNDAAYLVSIVGIVSIFCRPLFGWIGDRSRQKLLFLYGILPFLEGAVVVCMPSAESYEILLLLSCISGIVACPFTSMILAVLVELVGSRQLAPAYGFWLFSCGIGVLIGPPLAGWFSDWIGSYVPAFYLSAALFMVSSVLMLIWPIKLQTTKQPSKRKRARSIQEIMFVVSGGDMKEDIQPNLMRDSDLCVFYFP